MDKVIISSERLRELKDGLLAYLKRAYEYHGSDDTKIPHIIKVHVLKGDGKRCRRVMAILQKVTMEFGEYGFEDIVNAIIATSVMPIKRGDRVKMAHIKQDKLMTEWED